jgi:hypothetical protein
MREQNGGSVATQTQFAPLTKANAHPIHPETLTPELYGSIAKSTTCAVVALTIEFVAKPQAVRDVHSAIPEAINADLRDVTGFAGCLTMISDQESRLVTVVTFWTGEDRAPRCSEVTRRVQKLVSPYLDRCLRLRTFHAYFPAVSALSRAFSETSSEVQGDRQSKQENSPCAA